jgi:hypothetical protein
VSLLDGVLINKIVEHYNHTTHAAFNKKFSPLQAQVNPEVEQWYIQKQQYKLVSRDLSSFRGYKPGDYLLVHVPYKFNYKRRRNFNELALFTHYEFGNVGCILRRPNYDHIVLPLYFTKKICSEKEDLPKEVKDYFDFYEKR